jgi:hypothetical protein
VAVAPCRTCVSGEALSCSLNCVFPCVCCWVSGHDVLCSLSLAHCSHLSPNVPKKNHPDVSPLCFCIFLLAPHYIIVADSGVGFGWLAPSLSYDEFICRCSWLT